MPRQPSPNERQAELHALLHARALGRLSRRTLDFAQDFPVTPGWKQRAISLRSQYNHFQVNNAESKADPPAALFEMARELVGELSDLDAPEVPQVGNVMFRAEQLSKTFKNSGQQFRLHPIDFELCANEITGVVGENGNGKTTLLRIVAGDLAATSGSLNYPDVPAPPNDWYKIRQHIAFLPQPLEKWQGFLKENLHFQAAIHGVKGRENEERVEFVLHRLGLSPYAKSLWSEISSGYKLRFALARALVWRPRIIVIDEPLANLDVNAQQLFLQDLRDLANSRQNPLAILLTSQHLHEVESVADKLIFLRNGQSLYNGPMAEFGKSRVHNTFELSTLVSESRLRAALSSMPIRRFSHTGTRLVFETDLSVGSTALLAALSDANIPITYFRDISNSTRKLFDDPNTQ